MRKFMLVALLLLIGGAAQAHDVYGTWPKNDQRNGECEFSDWSRFAFVQSVYDGDTITVDLDQGFQMMWVSQKIRFYGVNSPEIRTRDLEEKALGIEARDWLRGVIDRSWVVLTTHKYESGKFGRKLATVCRDGRQLIGEMIESGMTREAVY